MSYAFGYWAVITDITGKPVAWLASRYQARPTHYPDLLSLEGDVNDDKKDAARWRFLMECWGKHYEGMRIGDLFEQSMNEPGRDTVELVDVLMAIRDKFGG